MSNLSHSHSHGHGGEDSGNTQQQQQHRIQGRKINNSRPPSLMELVCMKQWQQARELVEEDPYCIYQASGRNSRLVIHELCKVMTSSGTVEGELSDDEDEEAIAINNQFDSNGGGGGSNTGGGGSGGCTECVKEDNLHINEFVKFMIETSHSLGPYRVELPDPSERVVDDDDDGDEDGEEVVGEGEEEEGQNAIEEQEVDHQRDHHHHHPDLDGDDIDSDDNGGGGGDNNGNRNRDDELALPAPAGRHHHHHHHRRGGAPEHNHHLGEEGNELEEEEETTTGEGRTTTSTTTEKSYRIHDSILTVTDVLGKTPLHSLCENSADNSMMELIFSCTRENTGNLSAPTALSLIAAKDDNGSTPLHYLSYSRVCPFSSLILMMDYCCPEPDHHQHHHQQGGGGEGTTTTTTTTTLDPTLCQDMDGDTPLHWALDGYMSPRRVKQLLRYHKKALWVRNSLGRRPLDQFVENFVDSDWYLHELCGREVWENIQGYLKVIGGDEDPNGSQQQQQQQQQHDHHFKTETDDEDDDDDEDDNNNGRGRSMKKETPWLPLHLLAGSPIDFPPIFLDIALHFCEHDVSKTDSRGMLPLHLACARKSGHPDNNNNNNNNNGNDTVMCDGIVAAKILSLNASAAFQRAAGTHRLPLHIAIETRKPLQLIANLLKSYPSSLNIPDPVTRLYPFLLAGACNNEDASVSYGLLRADPSIVQAAVAVSNAARSGYSSDSSDDYQEQASKMLRTRLRIDGGPRENDDPYRRPRRNF